ncbi:hypothetical protein [Chlorobaculum limnaeum]|uniref:hypothetical protein n=1 Tax=Chlorobaculum limnaeum TaxID=274537 RepID=UPI001969B833|nr:hypothetical protein [Chlorobaculum limnaeum]
MDKLHQATHFYYQPIKFCEEPVFEMTTQHKRRDFGEFDSDGQEVVKRWYTFKWTDDTDFVATKIATKLAEVVHAHVENTIKRLSDEDSKANG